MGKKNGSDIRAELFALREAKGNPRAKCKITKYLEKHPEAAPVLDEAVTWFVEQQDGSFGADDLRRYLQGKFAGMGLSPFEISRSTMDRWILHRG